MKKVEKKEKNPFITFISTEVLILYLVLYIGSAILEVNEEASMFLIRHLPIGIVTFLSIFLLSKKFAKKINISLKDTYKKFLIALPIILGVATLLLGLYSIRLNIEEVKESNEYKLIERMGSVYLEEADKLIEEEKHKARMSWGITVISIIVSGEIATFLVKEKLDPYYIVEQESEKEINLNEENKNEMENKAVTENAASQVKWNL